MRARAETSTRPADAPAGRHHFEDASMSTSQLKTFDLSSSEVALYRDGTSDVIASAAGPPPRVDGFTVGAPVLDRNPPHDGEMHPDGDELVYLISGRVDVIVEDQGVERVVELTPGQALVIPKGVWHRVTVREPSQILYITPGPGGEVRMSKDR